MIAKIMEPFSSEMSLSEKINYHIKKMEGGVAEFIYDNSHIDDIYQLFPEMKNVGSMNDRVSNKFCEIIISLAPGEKLEQEKFKDLAREYMEKMGYSESCYNIWRHFDKEHDHIHILLTTIGYDGQWIDDHYSHRRSQELSRKLEEEYGLKPVVYNKFSNEPLNLINSRRFYFNNALKKGLRAYNTKILLENLLKGGGYIECLKQRDLSNKEIEELLGSDLYQQVGDVLDEKKLFKKLYKDELLGIMDVIYDISVSKEDFFKRLEDVGLYVRMVSQKGNDSYVYGIKDANIYFNDKQLPQTYRFANISKFGERNPKILLTSEQKNRIHNKVFIALGNASNFHEFGKELEKLGVTLISHKNKNGVYGISFKLNGISDPFVFKASEISRKTSYRNLVNYFEERNKSLRVLVKDSPVLIQEMKDREEIYEGGNPMMNQYNDQTEDFLKKKKKKKGKDREQKL